MLQFLRHLNWLILVPECSTLLLFLPNTIMWCCVVESWDRKRDREGILQQRLWQLWRQPGGPASRWRFPHSPITSVKRQIRVSAALKDAAQLWCPSNWNGLTANKSAREEEMAGNPSFSLTGKTGNPVNWVFCFSLFLQSCRGPSLARSDEFGWPTLGRVLPTLAKGPRQNPQEKPVPRAAQPTCRIIFSVCSQPLSLSVSYTH